MTNTSVDVARPIKAFAAPIYPPTMDEYPTGPIENFPPPVPLVHNRHSLRSRRGVIMQVQIPHNPHQSPPSPWSAKGHIQPHRNHLPRRRNPKRFVITHELTLGEQKPPRPSPLRTPGERESALDAGRYEPNVPLNDPSVQEVIERLYVAFASGEEALDELPKPEDMTEPYTHVVSIIHGGGEGTTEQVSDARIQRLRLVLPARAREECPRAGLGLTDSQLRAARDFVAQALPSTSTRVLVTAPFGRPTDAMCAVMCSLSMTTKKDVEVLQDEVETETMLSVWKGEICGNEVERIQKIAKAWSWTQAVQHAIN